MTTAHRPTWAPAKGGEEQGGSRFYAPSQMKSIKDIAGFTKLKYRQTGQGSLAEMSNKDLASELEEKEKKHFLKSYKEEFLAEKEEDLKLLESNIPDGGGAPRLVPRAIDADDDDDDQDVEESDDSDDDSDDEAELLAELERIKQERAEEAAKKAAEEAEESERALQAEVVGGNPLLQGKLVGNTNFAMKRRWDDDVVFRNQARNEPKQQRRFINDTIRNDFHRRFLDRYMK